MERLAQLQQWLKEKTEESKAAEQTLREDERQDEAAFQKIRGNVYGIFCAVADAARKQAAPEAFFESKLAEIPANWEAALQKARQFGAAENAVIEEIKLAAAEEIRKEWEASV